MSRSSAMRRSHSDRTRSNTPAAKALAEAFSRQIEYAEENGQRIRKWRRDELQSYSNDDIARAVARRRALEYVELVDEIPPPAVKYAGTKGWLREIGGLYYVTEKGAADLKLPRRGHDGLAIRFVSAG